MGNVTGLDSLDDDPYIMPSWFRVLPRRLRILTDGDTPEAYPG